MEPAKKTIDLDHPFTHGGEQITRLTLRRPKVKDIKRAASATDQAEASFKMICDLAEIAPDRLDEVDAADFGKVTDWLESVLPKEKPSPGSSS